MARNIVSKSDINKEAELLRTAIGAKEVTVQHGNWSGYHIATVVTFTFDGWNTITFKHDRTPRRESLTIPGTRRDVMRCLQVSRQLVGLVK